MLFFLNGDARAFSSGTCNDTDSHVFFYTLNSNNSPRGVGAIIKKVMKKLFLLLAMLTAMVLTAGAQSMQVATLSHEGTITSYTSADALRQAYEAAVDGDVITLSSGVFNSVNLEKRITVRGAGMGVKVNDSDPYIEPTIIKGSFNIITDDSAVHNTILEGVVCKDRVYWGGLGNKTFSKCRFTYLDHHLNAEVGNPTFIQCVFDEVHITNNHNGNCNFYSCYMGTCPNTKSIDVMTNCIINLNPENNGGRLQMEGIVKNSIFIFKEDLIQYNFIAYNSIFKGPVEDRNRKAFLDNGNYILSDDIQLFKEGSFYQLTDDTKTYLGTDGTEVGIYGGTLAFDPTPTNPQIIKFNVAPKTTLDGKLSIDIEVYAK